MVKICYLSFEKRIKGFAVTTVNWKKIENDGLDKTVRRVKAFNPDIIIEREFNDGRSDYSAFLSHFDCPKVLWVIDTHVKDLRHYTSKAKSFDVVFTSIYKHAKLFDNLWMPLYCSIPVMQPVLEHTYDLTFVGNVKEFHKKRRAYIDFLKPYGIKTFVDYVNMPHIINSSKISTNFALSYDLNFRVFEVLGCGSLLLTDVVDDMHRIPELFSMAAVFYGTKNLGHQVRRLLDEPFNFERCSKNVDVIQSNHMLEHRIDSIVKTVLGYV